jgi:predicted AAA+ superfamily ATPase
LVVLFGIVGALFENLVATSINKRLHFLEDRDGYRYELRYIRDKEGREIDFAIVKDGVLIELIETKYADDKISRSLVYYTKRLNPQKATQIVAKLKRPYDKGNINVVNPISYFIDRGFYHT